jgi:hypothetical protein
MDSAKTAAIKNRCRGKIGGASFRSTFAKFSCVSAAKRLAEEEKGQSVVRGMLSNGLPSALYGFFSSQGE